MHQETDGRTELFCQVHLLINGSHNAELDTFSHLVSSQTRKRRKKRFPCDYHVDFGRRFSWKRDTFAGQMFLCLLCKIQRAQHTNAMSVVRNENRRTHERFRQLYDANPSLSIIPPAIARSLFSRFRYWYLSQRHSGCWGSANGKSQSVSQLKEKDNPVCMRSKEGGRATGCV